MDFGHWGKDCKKQYRYLYTKLYRKCGKDGHLGKTCNEAPNCMLCMERNNKESGHVTDGSIKCPVYISESSVLKMKILNDKRVAKMLALAGNRFRLKWNSRAKKKSKN